MLKWPDRTTREKLDYGFDWSPVLEEGETIAAHAATTTSDIDIFDESLTGTVQTIWVQGGTASYAQIALRIDTSRGRTFEEVVRLNTKV